ncbi:hypothetical protein BC829DRAFT_388868, partial [Chytridium lagenaria]
FRISGVAIFATKQIAIFGQQVPASVIATIIYIVTTGSVVLACDIILMGILPAFFIGALITNPIFYGVQLTVKGIVKVLAPVLIFGFLLVVFL